MTEDKKSKEVSDFIDGFAKKHFGTTRTESQKNSKCVICGGDASKFKDDLSRKEYTISGMCQKCQDKTFGY